MSENVIDIITKQVVERVGPEIEKRVGGEIEKRTQDAVRLVTERVQVEAERRINAAVAEIPQIAIRAAEQSAGNPIPGELVLDGGVDARADAKDRAWRTLVQGLFVTVILAVVTAFGTAVAAPDFDLLTWDSWKAAATAAGAAVMISITAYIQRLISPPKTERNVDPSIVRGTGG